MNTKIYNKTFYDSRREMTLASAKKVLFLYANFFPINSVVDIGCGTGTWLSVAKDNFSSYVFGYEGSWVRQAKLDIPSDNVEHIDLENRIKHSESFDVAISLEVAEHLSEKRGVGFVEDLTHLSNRVIFSAAVPGQGGVNHLNERPHEYWIQTFQKYGFQAYDVFRPELWGDPNIPYWYQQNIFLFIRRGEENEKFVQHAARTFIPELRHPDLTLRQKPEPSLRKKMLIAGQIPRDVISYAIGKTRRGKTYR